MAQKFHSKHIKLQLETVTKHFLRESEYAFQENNLELKAYISNALRKLMVSSNTEPHCVLQNWDDIMVLMMCRMHLDREVHSAGDLSDPV